MKLKKILGIDIGGSGVKGAIVNTKKGKLITERYRIPTPSACHPRSCGEGHQKNCQDILIGTGPIGAGFPGVIQQGVARTAANVDNILDR